ncbi:hypothetical protein NCER_100441 [Vairimorpha ceranae BRL01]|uniref:Uncharacterized protein n=1 Tax=Vairimorpha ceranae (strain BRL01) TaxID=578460 RepID=C4V7K7_VAIC1|nr:hypothetical protein NCER_100441 [Vairimorpha ceranae BRL01]
MYGIKKSKILNSTLILSYSNVFSVSLMTFFVYAFMSSLYCVAASTLAGLSQFGDVNKHTILIITLSGCLTGIHLSLNSSYPKASSPGLCKMLIQTFPSESIFGCHISEINLNVGGASG